MKCTTDEYSRAVFPFSFQCLYIKRDSACVKPSIEYINNKLHVPVPSSENPVDRKTLITLYLLINALVPSLHTYIQYVTHTYVLHYVLGHKAVSELVVIGFTLLFSRLLLLSIRVVTFIIKFVVYILDMFSPTSKQFVLEFSDNFELRVKFTLKKIYV